MPRREDGAAAARPIVVMKFGGTSVADSKGREAIARRVIAAQELGKAPVVVVSAMGRKGQPYATDTLLGLVADMPPDERELDLLACVGEIISAIVVAHELRGNGVNARAFTGPGAGIATDGVAGEASITTIYTAPLSDSIASGEVPVVTGFQGLAEDGTINTLGRGGSDTTACALGVALQAEEVEIYTDVDGVMTADPRACQGTAVLESIHADELFQMARNGSRVVHTPAAELALESGLAVRVRNTFTDHGGTLVANIASYRPDSVATAVSHIDGIVRVKVFLPESEGTPGHMGAQTRLFRAMADAGVSLDMFTPAGDLLIFAVSESDAGDARSVLDAIGVPFEIQHGLAKVTLVGAGMHGVPGVMAQMAECLEAAQVDVLQVADSHTTISVLVTSENASPAIQALHDGFGLAG